MKEKEGKLAWIILEYEVISPQKILSLLGFWISHLSIMMSKEMYYYHWLTKL